MAAKVVGEERMISKAHQLARFRWALSRPKRSRNPCGRQIQNLLPCLVKLDSPLHLAIAHDAHSQRARAPRADLFKRCGHLTARDRTSETVHCRICRCEILHQERTFFLVPHAHLVVLRASITSRLSRTYNLGRTLKWSESSPTTISSLVQLWRRSRMTAFLLRGLTRSPPHGQLANSIFNRHPSSQTSALWLHPTTQSTP